MVNKWKTKKKFLKKNGWSYANLQGIEAWKSPKGFLATRYMLNQIPIAGFPQIVRDY